MTTIFIVVALVFIALVAGIGSLVYLLIRKNFPTMETKTKALDVFVYLGIFITLVVSVTNIISILFTAIERKYTDVLEQGMYVDIYGSDMRMAIALLVVMFPIYLALSMYVSRDIKKFFYKRDLLVRKVFIYTALFVTIATLLGSLVATIYYFLGGELTIRFGLKALTVFVIAAAVFGYYFYSLKRDYTRPTHIPAVLAIVSALLVLGALVWSITIIGTPAEMRKLRIDEQRLNDISRMQSEIYSHFQSTDKLPATLSDLNDAFQGYVVPADPVTGQTYGYHVIQQPVVRKNLQLNTKELITPGIFELCATFDTKREYTARGTPVLDVMYSAKNAYYVGDTTPYWNHDVGETCFKRVISADMYYGRF